MNNHKRRVKVEKLSGGSSGGLADRVGLSENLVNKVAAM